MLGFPKLFKFLLTADHSLSCDTVLSGTNTQLPVPEDG
jgi:hypothetical protein